MARRRTMDYTIADRLAELRRAQGLSQEALAAGLGLTRQAVSRWERGESLPDTENLIALADLYGVTLDELVRPQAAAEEGAAEEAAEEALTADEPAAEGPAVIESPQVKDAPAASGALTVEEARASDEAAQDSDAPRILEPQSAPADALAPEPARVPEAVTEAATPPVPHELPFAAQAAPGGGARESAAYDQPEESRAYRAGGLLAKILVGFLVTVLLCSSLVAGGCMLFRWRRAEDVAEYPDGSTTWSSADNTGEYFIDAGQVESLSIDWAAGPVKVMVVDDEEIGPEVIATEEYLDEKAAECPMKVGVEHGTLIISYCDHNPFGLQMDKGKRLTVRIPATLARQLQGVSCELAGGSLELADLTCQTLDLELAGGTMDVHDVIARDLDVEAAAGEATVRGSFARAVNMDLSAGSVCVSSGVVPAATDIDVSLGEVTLELPSDASFKANVDKAAGTFELDFKATQKGDTYTVGSGDSTVDVDIAGGSVHIRER